MKNNQDIKKKHELTHKQRLFCDEWLIHRNATRAYMFAYGVDRKVASVEGCRSLVKPSVRSYLNQRLSDIEKKYQMDLDACISGLSRIAKSNMIDYINLDGTINLSDLDHDKAAAIQEISVETYEERTGRGDETETVKRVKIKLYDKRLALIDLGKHFGGFKTKVEHSVGDELSDLIKKARERIGKDF